MIDSVYILGNHKSSNHFKEILKLSKKSDELILVSPFLTNDMGTFLEKMSSIQKLTVYTVFEGYNDALNKAESILELYKYCESNNIELSVKINDDLHGKVYLYYKGEKEKGCLITSANFTSKGLVNNYEWGVRVDNVEQQKLLRSEIEEIPVSDVNRNQIEAIHKAAEEFKKNNPVQPEKKFKINKFINIKPAKIGNTKMGYYKINSDKSEFKELNKDDRWPWKIRVECNSVPFSQEWWEYEIRTNDLVGEFKELYPDKHITYNGGDTLGALKWGKDRIKLTEEFATFLIDKIDEKWKS